MHAHGTALVEEGIAAIAFGDLSVSGALALKERQLSPLGLEIVEPLWTGDGPFRPGSAESQSRQRAVDDRAGRQVVLLIEVLHRAGLTERVDAERHGGHTER